ncbi:MAG: DUF1697 domain-containing protein [Patescibacteria group bacterium]|jgi:uncharacterized protein (DUF1697 family)
MKYIALLRGINVGGNNLIKMADLKAVFEDGGFQNVSTYIQSGNVLFESDDDNSTSVSKKLEKLLSETFVMSLRVMVRSYDELRTVLTDVPHEWKTRDDIRCYVAFVREPVTEEDVVKEIKLKDGVDFVKTGPGVVYMTTLTSGLTKSGFTKLVGKKIYQDLTMRNYNTTRKIFELMGN